MTGLSPFQPRRVLQVGSYIVLAGFLTLVLVLGIWNEVGDNIENAVDDELESFGAPEVSRASEFGQYIYLQTIGSYELDFSNPRRRLLFIGDVHGMKDPLDRILKKSNYSPSSDMLIHLGDILAKGKHKDSLAVLDFMASRNVTGIRGNHDQMVIEWRAWRERALSHSGGAKWLKEMERKSKKELSAYVKKGKGSGWKRIPKGWEFMGDHYRIARDMSAYEYAYLLSLPLVLHIPELHTFVVHAGVLPLDPHRSVTSSRQPLAHVPERIRDVNIEGNKEVTILRHAQERAVLADIPQNSDPWVILNIRGLLGDNSVTRDPRIGEPWADLWNAIISRCDGFDTKHHLSIEGDPGYGISSSKLPCYPSTVIYGHAAARGLDINRWSKGLDTGCVYGKKLTALVLSPRNAVKSFSDDLNFKSIKYGEKGLVNAQLVSVKCKKR